MVDFFQIPTFPLNWLLISELVLLACMAVLGLIGAQLARQDPNDPVFAICRAFWNEFLFPSVGISKARPSRASGGGTRRKPVVTNDEVSDEDEFYGRVPKDASGKISKIDLMVLVIPHAANDSVVGRDGDGIKVQVVGEAGESRSNKSLVEMVANALGVKPFQVSMTKGHYQTRKTVQVQGVSADELQVRLSGLADAE